MNIPLLVLLIVFVLIAVRQVGKIRFQIWHVMLLGAITVLVTGQISPIEAFKAVNFDVIFFLFGMFLVGQALEDSGYLSRLSYKLFKKSKSVDHLILLVLFGVGLASAFLMNDTLAIIGTPAILFLARKHRIHPQVLLLALAFAITLGSVTSPIGNPQNLLISINGGISSPFVTFIKYLLIPTIVNLFLAYLVLKFFYKEHFHDNVLIHVREPIKDYKLAMISKISLILLTLLVIVKILLPMLGSGFDFKLTYIALISALPIIVFSEKRLKLLRDIDWSTLVFFAAMFILMRSVWDSGFFQGVISSTNLNITSTIAIIIISVLVSQLISNVPLVVLYMPMLLQAGAHTKELMALAAGSTIAGNLMILGAASNVIIIHNAERKSGETLTFLEFAKVGIPLTIINMFVYWLFLSIF